MADGHSYRSTSNITLTPTECKIINDAYLWSLRIFGTLFLVGGTMGNVLIIVIKTRPVVRWSNNSIYMVSLAVADESNLLTGLMRHYLIGYIQRDISSTSLTACRLVLWLQYSFQYTAVWILVAFNIERAIRVATPLAESATWARTLLCVISIASFWLGLNSYRIFGATVITITGCDICTTGQTFAYFNLNIWPWLNVMADCILPLVCFVVSHVFIILAMEKRNATIGLAVTRRSFPQRSLVRRSAAPPPQPSAVVNLAVPAVAHADASSSVPFTGSQSVSRAVPTEADRRCRAGMWNASVTSYACPPSQPRRASRGEVPFFWALLMTDVVFLLLVAPRDIFIVFWIHHQQQADLDAAFRILSLVAFITNATNFCVYTLSSYTFRDEVRAVLCRSLCRENLAETNVTDAA